MNRSVGGAVAVAALLWLAPAASAQFRRAPETLGGAVDKSENIVLAVCDSVKTELRYREVQGNRAKGVNFVTIYTMRKREDWRGVLQTGPGGTFIVEELGGMAPNATLGLVQYVPGGSGLAPGEEAVLFYRRFKSDPALTANGVKSLFSDGNPVLVHPQLGRFTVVTDRETGEKYAVGRGDRMREQIAVGSTSGAAMMNKMQRDLQAWKRRPGAAAAGKSINAAATSPPAFNELSALKAFVTGRAGNKPAGKKP